MTETDQHSRYDAIIIGAGVTGIYQLYKLLELGMDATVLETGSGLSHDTGLKVDWRRSDGGGRGL